MRRTLLHLAFFAAYSVHAECAGNIFGCKNMQLIAVKETVALFNMSNFAFRIIVKHNSGNCIILNITA